MAEENNKGNVRLSQSQIYDLLAPTVYGKILSIVHKGPIADSVLEKVFVNAFLNKNYFTNSLSSPLITLLNASNSKSTRTMKALSLLRDCCEVSGVCVTDKK